MIEASECKQQFKSLELRAQEAEQQIANFSQALAIEEQTRSALATFGDSVGTEVVIFSPLLFSTCNLL